jgi:prevent-host-death family protein
MIMTKAATVTTRELKSRLSHYLRLAKSGQTVEITERGVPIGSVVATGLPVEDRVRAMARSGLLAWNRRKLGSHPARAKVRGRKAVAQLLVERYVAEAGSAEVAKLIGGDAARHSGHQPRRGGGGSGQGCAHVDRGARGRSGLDPWLARLRRHAPRSRGVLARDDGRGGQPGNVRPATQGCGTRRRAGRVAGRSRTVTGRGAYTQPPRLH